MYWIHAKVTLLIWAASLFLVPLQVELQTIAYSPRHIYLFWEKLDQMALRGNLSNQEFIVDILGDITTQQSTSMEVGGLDRGTQFTFKVWILVMWPLHGHSSCMTMYFWLVPMQVQVSNGQLISEPAVAFNTTLLRPPFPKEHIVSNTSLTCQVFFHKGHIGIAQIMVSADSAFWTQMVEELCLIGHGFRVLK